MHRSLFLAMAGLVISQALNAEGPILLVPGQAAVYEGTLQVKQVVGDASNTQDHEAKLICSLKEAVTGKLEALVVRWLKSTEPNSDALVGFDVLSLQAGSAGWKLLPLGAASAELREGAAELNSGLQIRLFPDFSAPAPGKSVKGEAELPILGSLTVKAIVATSARAVGATVELERRLAEGTTPEIRFQDESSKLVAWSEILRFETPQALPSRLEQELVLEGIVGASKVRFEKKLSLVLKSRSEKNAPEAVKLDELDRSLREIHADFVSIKPPEELAKRVEKLAAMAKGTAFEMAAPALERRLAIYKQMGLGKLAPDFTLESLDGKQVSFREFTRGKVTLLSFWGVGCPPCRREAPFLTKFFESYKSKGFTVVAVNGYDETRAVVEDFATKQALKHPILLMGGKVSAELFNVEGFPTIVWIDASGRIVGREIGFDPSHVPELEKQIQQLLAPRESTR